MQKTQEWKTIDVAPIYQMNNLGDIRNTKTQKCVKGTMSHGYRVVSLNLGDGSERKTFHIHRLYAKLFISNPDNKPFAVFMSKDRLLISADNIQWMTKKEKSLHVEKLLGVSLEEIRKKAVNTSMATTGFHINFIDEKGNTKFYPSASACARAEGMSLYQVLKRME